MKSFYIFHIVGLLPCSTDEGDFLAGSLGPRGFTGQTGFTGATGSSGFTGEMGFPGISGATGFTGVVGSTGNSGNRGFPGTPGIRGMLFLTSLQPFLLLADYVHSSSPIFLTAIV